MLRGPTLELGRCAQCLLGQDSWSRKVRLLENKYWKWIEKRFDAPIWTKTLQQPQPRSLNRHWRHGLNVSCVTHFFPSSKSTHIPVLHHSYAQVGYAKIYSTELDLPKVGEPLCYWDWVRVCTDWDDRTSDVELHWASMLPKLAEYQWRRSELRWWGWSYCLSIDHDQWQG